MVSTLELRRTTSHFWSLFDVDIQIITKGTASSPAQFLGTQTMQNHLRRHLPTSLELSILLQLLYSTTLRPRIQLNLLYSPTLQPNFIRYQSQVKPSHTPLEAGISVKTTVDALTAQSVQPQGSHLPKVGGWNPGHRYTLKKRSPGKKIIKNLIVIFLH